MSDQALAKNVVVDTRDLSSIAPTVNFQSGASVANTSFSLRGVSSAATGPGFQPSTSLVVDGVPLYTQGEFVSNLSDVERIEILNGPQGTLFGKNSTAGVVNIVTKAPKDHFEGNFEAMTTTDQQVLVRSMLNVPVTQGVRLRLNGFYNYQDPLIKNLGTGGGYLGERSYGVSGKLAIDLSDTATFTLAGTYTHIRSSANQSFPVGPNAFPALYTGLTGINFGRGITTFNMNTPAQDLSTTKRVIGTLEWHLADKLVLTSISSYSNYKTDFDLDIDDTQAGANVGQVRTLPNSMYPIQYLSTFDKTGHLPVDYKYASEELRLNYDSGPLSAVGGTFMQFVKADNSIHQPIQLDGSLAGAVPGQAYVSDTQTRTRLHDNTISVFGDATYRITSTIKLFGGLRYTHEVFKDNYHRQVYFVPAAQYDAFTGVFDADPVATYNVAQRQSLNNLSGRAGVQYEPTSHLHFYASYARGYKGPSADTSASVPVGRDPLVKPEKADAFEIGAKMRLFDNRLVTNIALFHEKIRNIQENLYDPTNVSTASFVLQNAGDLTTRGVEGDATWAISRDFSIAGSVAYVKATYSNFAVSCNSTVIANGTCGNTPAPGLENADGFPAIGAPRWKYSVTGNYEHHLDNGLGVYANVSWTWTDKIQYAINNDPTTVEPSHGMLNATVGVKGAGDRWEVQLFGKNLTNKFYYSWLANAAVFGQPVGWIPRDYKRYGGVRLITRF